MKISFAEGFKLGKNTFVFTKFTPAEFFLWTVVKFFAFLCFLWPFELCLVFFVWILKLFLWILVLPFRLLFGKK